MHGGKGPLGGAAIPHKRAWSVSQGPFMVWPKAERGASSQHRPEPHPTLTYLSQ